MARFENVVTIRRSAHEVFAFLADLENLPRWNSAIEETKKVSPGAVGVGTTYRQVRSLPTRSAESLEITRFEPPTTLEVSGFLGPFPAIVTYQVEPSSEGTRLVNRVDLRFAALAQLLRPVALPRIRDAVAANLKALAELLEREHGTSASRLT